jgi:hypothetical protein
MRIHITQTTKQFLPEKVYKTTERGMIDIPGKSSLKTFLIVGKYNKAGEIDPVPYSIENDSNGKEKTKKNSKWDGFNLI